MEPPDPGAPKTQEPRRLPVVPGGRRMASCSNVPELSCSPGSDPAR